MSQQYFEQMFQLRLTVKQLNRASKKSERTGAQKKKQVAAAIKKGNMDAARIYAEDVIRLKNESLNYLRLAAKLEGVKSRLEAMKMNQTVVSQIGGVVKQMEKAMASQNLEQVTRVFDKFEEQNENSQVQDDIMNDAMTKTTSSMTPVSQVEELICQVADEYSLEVETLLPGINRTEIRARQEREKQETEREKEKVTN